MIMLNVNLKPLNELDLSKFVEVEGCHFITKSCFTDCEPLLIVASTAKTVKCIRLFEKCVKSPEHPKYEYFYDENELKDPKMYEIFRKSKKNPNHYVNFGYTAVLTKEPYYYYDREF